MSDIARELSDEYISRDVDIRNYNAHMVLGFNDFSQKVKHLLNGSDWILNIIPGDECELKNDFSFYTDIFLQNRRNETLNFQLSIKFEHLDMTKYMVSIPGTKFAVPFYADNEHDADNITNLSALLRCFMTKFPPVIPKQIRNF